MANSKWYVLSLIIALTIFPVFGAGAVTIDQAEDIPVYGIEEICQSATSEVITFFIQNRPNANTYIEYGLTENYGSSVIPNTSPVGNNVVRATATLTGLSPQTRYYYRIVLDSDTDNGEVDVDYRNRTFVTTMSADIAISQVRAEQITNNSAMVKFHAEGRTFTNPSVEYGVTTNYGQAASAGTINDTQTGFDGTAQLINLNPATRYNYKITLDKGLECLEFSDSSNYTFTTAGNQTENQNNPQMLTAAEQELRQRIQDLNYQPSIAEIELVERERQLVQRIDSALTNQLEGRILLQVENNGEAWYVDSETSKKFYLKDGASAYLALNAFGLGISNQNLDKIPIGIEPRAEIIDTDGDGLDDKLEEALGTDINNPDTDSDGHNDGLEVMNGYDPTSLNSQNLPVDASLVNSLQGRILLQVESRGQAWYVNPADGKRYYMKDGQQAYQIMRFLSLGITNENLRKIAVGQLQ